MTEPRRPMPVWPAVRWTDPERSTPLADVLACARAFPGSPMEVRLGGAALAWALASEEVGRALDARMRSDPNFGALRPARMLFTLLRLPVRLASDTAAGRVEVGPHSFLVVFD